MFIGKDNKASAKGGEAMALIKLNSREVARLEKLVTSTPDARQLKRAQALLWLTDGEGVEDVARRLRVKRQTVYNWIARFETRAGQTLEERLSDGSRDGRPPTALEIIDSLIDEVIEKDPRDFGYRSTIWTTPLLQRYLSDEHQIKVCAKSVGLAIARVRIAWKRPRHRLALRAWNWQQVKGGSSTASGRTSGRSS
ncbi:MAG: helix-turn-helix domain-containing protein [Blastocatellia bacterium]